MKLEKIVIPYPVSPLVGTKISLGNKSFVAKEFKYDGNTIVYTTFSNDIYKVNINTGEQDTICKNKQYYLSFK